MKRFVLCFFAIVILLSGCVSKLGYPIEQVPMPTEVTVRYDVLNEEAVIDVILDNIMTDVWKNLYQKRIRGELNEINYDILFENIGIALGENLEKRPKLFTPVGEIARVKETAFIPKKSEKKYSGYDFVSGPDKVTTDHVLMYQLVQYGYRASEGPNGPFLACSMLLIETQTGKTLWKTQKELSKKVRFSFKGPHSTVTAEIMAEMYDELIPESIKEIFMDLSE